MGSKHSFSPIFANFHLFAEKCHVFRIFRRFRRHNRIFRADWSPPPLATPPLRRHCLIDFIFAKNAMFFKFFGAFVAKTRFFGRIGHPPFLAGPLCDDIVLLALAGPSTHNFVREKGCFYQYPMRILTCISIAKRNTI